LSRFRGECEEKLTMANRPENKNKGCCQWWKSPEKWSETHLHDTSVIEKTREKRRRRNTRDTYVVERETLIFLFELGKGKKFSRQGGLQPPKSKKTANE